MEPLHALLLVGTGLLGGYIAGLVGLGGGIVFAPVLFFYFQSIGVPPEVLTQLTVGSSLLCTAVASTASAYHQNRRGAVDRGTAVRVGISSAAAVFLVTHYVTTQSWYDGQVFKIVFSAILLVVAARMFWTTKNTIDGPDNTRARVGGWASFVGIGSVAGVVSVAAGVGGGVVLVPSYNQFLGFPIQRSVGTSSATIVIIALVGSFTYLFFGLGVEGTTSTSLGYVDIPRAMLLSIPASLTARLGVRTAHQIQTKTLKRGFALLMLFIAIRLIWTAVTRGAS